MRAAAPPPTPLNAATICGIAVILTRRAAGTAMTVPIAIAPTMSRKLRQAVGGEGDADGEGHASGAEEIAVPGGLR